MSGSRLSFSDPKTHTAVYIRIMPWSIKAMRTIWSSFVFSLDFCNMYFWLCWFYQGVRKITRNYMPKVLPYELFKYYLNNLRSVSVFPCFFGGAEPPSTIKWLKGARKYVKLTVLFQSTITTLYNHIQVCLHEMLSWYFYLYIDTSAEINQPKSHFLLFNQYLLLQIMNFSF